MNRVINDKCVLLLCYSARRAFGTNQIAGACLLRVIRKRAHSTCSHMYEVSGRSGCAIRSVSLCLEVGSSIHSRQVTHTLCSTWWPGWKPHGRKMVSASDALLKSMSGAQSSL